MIIDRRTLLAGLAASLVTPSLPVVANDGFVGSQVVINVSPILRELLPDLVDLFIKDAGSLYREINCETFRREQRLKWDKELRALQMRGCAYAYRILCDDSNNPPLFVDNNGFALEIYMQVRSIVDIPYLSLHVFPETMTFKEAVGL